MDRAIDVAQCIFAEYKKLSGKVIDEMKLHKLLYLCQRESLMAVMEVGNYSWRIFGRMPKKSGYMIRCGICITMSLRMRR